MKAATAKKQSAGGIFLESLGSQVKNVIDAWLNIFVTKEDKA